jgi:diguanylate cyclase
LRGPQAFDLARHAVQDMERRHVWPTPLNFELWLHALNEPGGDLAKEINRLFDAGEAVTESISELLAAAYLPKARLNDQIRDAGDRLNRELASVTEAIKQAHVSSEQYGQTLAGARSANWSRPSPSPPAKCSRTPSRWNSGWKNPPPRSAA